MREPFHVHAPTYLNHGVPRSQHNSPTVYTQPLLFYTQPPPRVYTAPVYTQPLLMYAGIPCTNAQIPGTTMDTGVHSCHRHPQTYSQTGIQVHGSTHMHAWYIPTQGPCDWKTSPNLTAGHTQARPAAQGPPTTLLSLLGVLPGVGFRWGCVPTLQAPPPLWPF